MFLGLLYAVVFRDIGRKSLNFESRSIVEYIPLGKNVLAMFRPVLYLVDHIYNLSMEHCKMILLSMLLTNKKLYAGWLFFVSDGTSLL